MLYGLSLKIIDFLFLVFDLAPELFDLTLKNAYLALLDFEHLIFHSIIFEIARFGSNCFIVGATSVKIKLFETVI